MRIGPPSRSFHSLAGAAARAATGGFSVAQEGARPRATGGVGVAGHWPLSVESGPGELRKRMLRKGRRMLDALDSIKAAGLGRGDPSRLLKGLAEELADDEKPDDPALAGILDQIRIRSEVELAKAEVARSEARGSDRGVSTAR